MEDSMRDDNTDGDEDDEKSFTQSLSERISQVEQNESYFVAGLQRRVQSVTKAEEFDLSLISNNGNETNIVELPVVCFDALLPNQRLAGSTTDPTFCNLLRSFGLGGTFVMTARLFFGGEVRIDDNFFTMNKDHNGR